MKKPVILMSCSFTRGAYSPQRSLSAYYGWALDAVGAAGVVYTGGDCQFLARHFDALLLTGGGDVHPLYYGQEKKSSSLSIDEARDREEFRLLEAFCACRKPVLGICRGLQLINIYFGGSVTQHMEGHEDGVRHTVYAVPGSRVHLMCGIHFETNSFHHQAVDAPGENLLVTARAADGVIEAAEHASLPILGVQWHPERQTYATCMDTKDEHSSIFSFLLGGNYK